MTGVFNKTDLNLTTKIIVCNPVGISPLLYGCETCVLYHRNIQKFHQQNFVQSWTSNRNTMWPRKKYPGKSQLSKNQTADHKTPSHIVRICSKNGWNQGFQVEFYSASSVQGKDHGVILFEDTRTYKITLKATRFEPKSLGIMTTYQLAMFHQHENQKLQSHQKGKGWSQTTREKGSTKSPLSSANITMQSMLSTPPWKNWSTESSMLSS